MQVNQTSRDCRPKVQFQTPKLSPNKAKKILELFSMMKMELTKSYIH